jgi:hypothetical protein
MMIDPKAKLLAVLDVAEEYRSLAMRVKDRGEREAYERIVELYVEIAEDGRIGRSRIAKSPLDGPHRAGFFCLQVTTCPPFCGIMFPRDSEAGMPIKRRASAILGTFEKAQSELVGKAVVLADGKAGTVEDVWLDELHGLRISISGHDGKWPASTVKFEQS